MPPFDSPVEISKGGLSELPLNLPQLRFVSQASDVL